jgi:predicted RNase H-like HicB family nuclease
MVKELSLVLMNIILRYDTELEEFSWYAFFSVTDSFSGTGSTIAEALADLDTNSKASSDLDE